MICPHCNEETTTKYFSMGVGQCEHCKRIIQYEMNGWQEVAELLEGKYKDAKAAADKASDLIIESFTFKTMKDNEELWLYNEGYYKTTGETTIKEIVQKQNQIKEKVSTHFINEIINGVKRKTYIQREDFEAPLKLICVKNGIYDIETKALVEHDPKYYFKSKIEFNYNPLAKCNKIDEFLSETLEPKYVALGYEIPAWCLYREYFIQKAMMFTGTGQNGKSVYFDLLIFLLGNKNCSSETLQSMCNTNWGTAELFGKLANVCGDLPSVLLKDSGEFKKLTSGFAGDSISAQKKFQNPFQFVNKAKLLFATNEIPESKDQSDGFFRRWIIVDFPYTFVSGLEEDKYKGFIKKEDKNIIKELICEEEMEGFLLKSLNKLSELLEIREFSNSPTTEEVKRKYNMKSNSAVVFIETFITDEVEQEANDPEPFVEKEFLLNEYKDWCKDNGIQVKSNESFFKHIKDRWQPGTERKLISLGKRKYCYTGITYVPDWKNL
jgi:putative DNA primase/helicase